MSVMNACCRDGVGDPVCGQVLRLTVSCRIDETIISEEPKKKTSNRNSSERQIRYLETNRFTDRFVRGQAARTVLK